MSRRRINWPVVLIGLALVLAGAALLVLDHKLARAVLCGAAVFCFGAAIQLTRSRPSSPSVLAPGAGLPVNDYGLRFYEGLTMACDAPFTSTSHGICFGCTGCSCHLMIDHPHTSAHARAVREFDRG